MQRNSNAGCGRETLIPQHARLQWQWLRLDDRITDLALPLRYREFAERRNALISAIWDDASMSDDPVLARVSRHLESIEDVTLLLLKSHLLVEQQINSALHKILPGFASLGTRSVNLPSANSSIRALDGTRKAENALWFAERLNLVRNR